MDESNDKMGLLMFIDDIGLLLSTFGVLLVFYLIQGSSVISTNVWIICLFFTGIKILLTGIADITGIARKLWVSVLFIVLADAVIILVNRFMSFGLSNMMLLITMVLDVVVIVVCLMIWKKIVGADTLEEDANRSAWVKDESREKPDQLASGSMPASQSFSTDDFESLFAQDEKEKTQEIPAQKEADAAEVKEPEEELLGSEDDFYATFGGVLDEEDAKPHQAAGKHAFEDSGDFDVIHFDDEDTSQLPDMNGPDAFAAFSQPAQEKVEASAEEAEAQPAAEEAEAPETAEAASEEPAGLFDDIDSFDAMIFADEPDHLKGEKTPAEEVPADEILAQADEVEAEPQAEAPVDAAAVEEVPAEEAEEAVDVQEASVEEAPQTEAEPAQEAVTEEAITDEDVAAAHQEAAKIPKEVTEQIEDEICKELDTIYNRMKASSEKSEVLSKNVENFSKEVDEMPAITSAEDIVKSGRLIRSKLRTIIDKQFVMDDVLNEVIETSEKINRRVAKLNQIEAELRERENRLNEQEFRLREEQEEASLFDDFTSPIEQVNTEASVERYQAIEAAGEEKMEAEEAEVEETSSVPAKPEKVEKKLVRPGEVLLENDEFSILIREEDLDLVKAYLSEHEI